jgi:Tol biopolymer transport system component
MKQRKRIFVVIVLAILIVGMLGVTYPVLAGKGGNGGGGKPPKDETPADPVISYYAFTSKTSSNGLSVMDADGSHQTWIFDTPWAQDGLYRTWSPDSSTIAYLDDQNLWMVDIEVVDGEPQGNNIRQITDFPDTGPYCIDNTLSWSPTDDVCAVVTYQVASYPDQYTDYTLNLIDTVPTNGEYQVNGIYTQRDQHIVGPRWNPDGTKIAFLKYDQYFSNTNNNFLGLVILTVSNGAVTSVIEISATDIGLGYIHSMDWAKTDDNLLSLATWGAEIYTIELDTLTTEYITDGFQQCWSPDDSKLVFSEPAIINQGKRSERTVYYITIRDLTTGVEVRHTQGLLPEWKI